MSRCTCSSRALELFIRDVAGLNLHSARATIRQHRRNFGTRPPFRQLETVSSGPGIDDGFIPFAPEKSGFAELRLGKHARKRARIAAQDKDVGKAGVKIKADDAEWHAEIEIAGNWPSRTREEQVAQTVPGEVVKKAEEKLQSYSVQESTVDAVVLHNLYPPPTVSSELMMAPPSVLVQPTTPSTATFAEPWDGKSRAENRLARKQRRMAEGTFARKKAEREQAAVQENEDEDEVASVLQKIEGLEGPAVEGKNKRKKERKAREQTAQAKQQMSKGRQDPKVDQSGGRALKTKETTQKAQIDEKQASTTKPDAKPQQTWRERRAALVSRFGSTSWQTQKAALTNKFGDEEWDPSKKLSPDTMSGIRALHASDPAAYRTTVLSQHFQVSPEAIRRILRSKWQPSEEVIEDRRVRWEKRGVRKWGDMAKEGMRPPKKWREAGVGWERKSRSAAPRSARVGRASGFGGRERRGEVAMEEGVGMLTGIEGGVEERID